MRQLLFAIFIISSASLFAQATPFEGAVHFTVEYTKVPENLQPYAQNLPTTFDLYIRNFLVCKAGPTALVNGYQIDIRNVRTKSGYMGTQVGGTAVAYRKYPKDYQVDLDAMPTPTSIKYIDETKTIAGFVCKKALVYFANNTNPLVVYYTTSIPANTHVIYKGLKGFALYFEMNNNGMELIATAKSVNPGKQEDSRFLMPAKYRLLSHAEYNQALIQELE